MMIFLPALFFGFCFINSTRRYGWNIEAYLFMLYFITGVASILVDANNLYGYNCMKMDIGIIAPLSYCLLLYLCIKPFGIIFRGEKIKKIVVKNEKVIDLFIYFSFIIFLIITIVAFTRINEILFESELSDIRREAYLGERKSFYAAYSGIPRYICALSTFFYVSSFICVPLFFYNLIYRKKKLYFHIITLLASTSQLVCSILQADRSQFLYWAIIFGFSYTVFHKQLRNKQLVNMLLILSPLITGILVYFIAVSISRWGEDNSNGWILYLGMNYINYCNFFNNLSGVSTSLCEIFPLTYMLLGEPGYFHIAESITRQSHIFIATFPTFIGLIYSISGFFILILYLAFYYTISIKFLKRKDLDIISLQNLIKMWIVALVPLLGIFGYFYMSYTATLAILIWLYLGKLTNEKTKISSR